MALKLPALEITTLTPRSSCGYPEPYRGRVMPREKRPLGDALGITKLGVNLTTLLPGKESSMRHFHSHEDEIVVVLEGEVVLRTNDGEQTLRAGDCAGFPAGKADAHQLVNRSAAPARYLEISNRDANDSVTYPDVDMQLGRDASGAEIWQHKDGSPY